MSELRVPIAEVSSVRPHSNADRLDIAEILGWQVVVSKGSLQACDHVLYVPPDSVVPPDISDLFGVTQYLSKGRVKAVRLRGEPSFGFAIPKEEARRVAGIAGRVLSTMHLHDNVAELFGITKYEPPIKFTAGDAAPDLALFPRYTDIENMRHYPALFEEGEVVVVTEKIHGTNCRVGIVEGEKLAGSHKVRRKEPTEKSDSNTYWFPWSLRSVEDMLMHYAEYYRQVVLYGEVYGKVQSLNYGLPSKLAFAAFDLLLDGKFMNAGEFRYTCEHWGVPLVPTLHVGYFDLSTIRELSEGSSQVEGAKHYREGVVVRPLFERQDPKLGRVILKYVGDEYLLGGKDSPGEH